MNIERIISQLSSLKDNSQSFITDDSDQIWKEDVDALEQATAILSVIIDEGITDYENLKDWMFDYNLMRADFQKMHSKFRVQAKPIHKDGVMHCPDCNKRVHPNHTHCHWCGKLLGGR